jgi:hypothetical protein
MASPSYSHNTATLEDEERVLIEEYGAVFSHASRFDW